MIALIVLFAILFWIAVLWVAVIIFAAAVKSFGLVVPLGIILAVLWWWILDSAEANR